MNNRLSLLQTENDRITQLVLAKSPLPTVESYSEMVDNLSARTENATRNSMNAATASAQELFTKAEALNPLAVLNRGFAYATLDGKNISSVEDTKSGDVLDIRLKDGSVKAEVI